MIKCICCRLSHQNPATYLFRAVLSCKRCLICADFFPDSDQNTFSLQQVLLWIHIWVKNILMLDLFQLLSSPDVNWWTGVLWCFYQTLILTAPIHCRASIAETLMQRHISPNLLKKQTHHLRWSAHLQQISFFKSNSYFISLAFEQLYRP